MGVWDSVGAHGSELRQKSPGRALDTCRLDNGRSATPNLLALVLVWIPSNLETVPCNRLNFGGVIHDPLQHDKSPVHAALSRCDRADDAHGAHDDHVPDRYRAHGSASLFVDYRIAGRVRACWAPL